MVSIENIFVLHGSSRCTKAVSTSVSVDVHAKETINAEFEQMLKHLASEVNDDSV